ncbi:DUF368 domain-containing protein [uncultured Pseudoramibacter sp.]|uniref:DUF368 domain-containing protein n=1 Tax=uncultured Pseudoramibacter sp. TaxID=1623493 RepID=UPI0025DC3382|nr:DUF368 domain-containing protein [uncultured Pseudoramibacter sp.]
MPIKEMFQGFCMALADSVPGVSGGSIAFIMGFYEKFIGSLNGIFSRDRNERREGFKFLIKLFAGWIIGMGLAVVALSNLFETHIYGISSLFLGFILVSIVVMMADPEMRRQQRGLAKWICLAAGAALVVVITVLHPNSNAALTGLSPASAIYIFIAGAAAISAMVLPGISGSTLLLVFGLYLPVIHGLKAAMTMNFSAVPGLIVLIMGIVVGAALISKWVKKAFETFPIPTRYAIIGMMIGSLYAIAQGPTTLSHPMPAMSLQSFNPVCFIVGIALVAVLEIVSHPSAFRDLILTVKGRGSNE